MTAIRGDMANPPAVSAVLCPTLGGGEGIKPYRRTHSASDRLTGTSAREKPKASNTAVDEFSTVRKLVAGVTVQNDDVSGPRGSIAV
jgi:hypothetical protein